jgi:hypothetical protein
MGFLFTPVLARNYRFIPLFSSVKGTLWQGEGFFAPNTRRREVPRIRGFKPISYRLLVLDHHLNSANLQLPSTSKESRVVFPRAEEDENEGF